MSITECERRVLVIIYELQENADFQAIREGVNDKYGTVWTDRAIRIFIWRLMQKKYVKRKKRNEKIYYYSVFERADIDKATLWDIRNGSFERDWEKVITYIREQQEQSKQAYTPFPK